MELEHGAPGNCHQAEPALGVEGPDRPEPLLARPPADDVLEVRPDFAPRRCLEIAQWTILAIASSTMSVAPRSFSAGISTLISALGTTASTA